MTIKTIENETYKVRVHFLFNEPEKKTLNYLAKVFGAHFRNYEDELGLAFSYYVAGEACIVIRDVPSSWHIAAILAHEGLHVTSRLLRHKGLRLTNSSEEAFTYFLSWIMQECMSIYEQSKKRKRRKK